MAEIVTDSAPPGTIPPPGGVGDPGGGEPGEIGEHGHSDRGDLIIRDRVLEQIARRAVLDIDGVVASTGRAGALLGGVAALGGSYPNTRVDASGAVPAIEVTVAVTWPCEVARVCRDAAANVEQELERLTGIRPSRVDVGVGRIVSDERTARKGFAVLPPAGDADAESAESADATHRGDVIDITTDTTKRKNAAPAAFPGAAIAGTVIGVLLLGLAAVGIHDHIVRFGWVEGTPWTESTARWVASSTWQNWMWAVAVVLVIVGLWLLWLAVKPRRKTHIRLADYEVMWTRRGDLARRVSTVMRSVPGVAHASTVVYRRRVSTSVTTDVPVDRAVLHSAADDAVSAVRRTPRIRIRTRSVHSQQTEGADT
ncbi:DUF6286 domain-containing Asp23/Gls24 family envelope stress response protein [Gordonia sp. NB41Y]|uniref:DUF6286 domain-containing Asp23/Gls24 family envelope stress response protein n=1 Tax=Gordonia sp. NB41Y TaxID=875808 RepID=UPI0002BF2F27|nr:DUF6286 domain-containing Asp23/Gls24 family envelope stress response protein [Gordonia sp. NB41Y]WLP92645.1 DUF6286 domain-containing protein [Gordonia sp. NB41Y]